MDVPKVFLIGLFLAFCPGLRAQRVTEQGEKDYREKVLPILQEHCYECHADGVGKGDLELDQFASYAAMVGNQKLWDHVRQHVKSHTMPPEGETMPAPSQRQVVANWIEDHVFYCDPQRPDPGKVTSRRLNRAEYNNTVRDIFSLDLNLSEDFPEDDTGYGFDNIADVLSLSPVLFEKYLKASRKVTSSAMSLEPPAATKMSIPGGRFRRVDSRESDHGAEGSLSLSSNGAAEHAFKIGVEGKYQIRINAQGEKGADIWPLMEVYLDHQLVDTVEVRRNEVLKDKQPYVLHTRLSKGQHQFQVNFINDFYDEKIPDKRNRDRNVVLNRLIIDGPYEAAILPPTAFQQWLLHGIDPQNGNYKEAVKSSLNKIGLKLFRRPLESRETEQLSRILEQLFQSGEPLERAYAVVLETMLVSPAFLFRRSEATAGEASNGSVQLDDYTLASRLSYFLWSSCPDEELLELAASGKLREKLPAQTARMLKDKRAQSLVDNFGGQWLQLRNLDIVTPDPRTFKSFSRELSQDMRRETELFFAYIIQNDCSVLDFLNADYTFVNERLARLYNLPNVNGADFRKVSLRETPRRGVLNQASILTITSVATRTSPVKRGKWILENILGTPPPPAPQNVPAFEVDRKVGVTGNLRALFEAHREDRACASCHALLDPIGFALENYNGIGAWRDKDGAFDIDASGKMNTGQTFTNYEQLRKILAEDMQADFGRRFSELLLTYALGRGMEFYDKLAVQTIRERLEKNNWRFSEAVLAVVDSVPFQRRRP